MNYIAYSTILHNISLSTYIDNAIFRKTTILYHDKLMIL